MADFFSKVKKTINKGTTVISVKSSTMIEVNKLKSEISSLKREKSGVFTNTGEKAYNMKKEGQIDISLIEEILARAFEIDEIIEVKEKAIEEALKNQEDTIKSLDEEVIEINNEIVCECGAKLSLDTKFCSRCGKKIEVIEDIETEDIIVEDSIDEDTDNDKNQEALNEITCECGEVLPYETVYCIKCGKKLK